MVTCGKRMPAIAYVTPLCKGKGRRVVLAKVGIMATDASRPGENVQWCKECGRYYNAEFTHECNMQKIETSRVALERWLKRYKIKSEGE